MRDPALGALARDIGMTGIALGVDGVVLLVEPLLGGFAGVDGAAQPSGEVRAHGRPPRAFFCFFGFRRPLEAEEQRPRPARAGDLAGDHGEAGVAPALVLILPVLRDGHVMLDAAVLAGQHRAGYKPQFPVALRGLAGLDQRLDAPRIALEQLGVDRAERVLLQLVGDAPFQELAVVGGVVRAVELPPQRLDLGHRQLRQPGDLRGNGWGWGEAVCGCVHFDSVFCCWWSLYERSVWAAKPSTNALSRASLANCSIPASAQADQPLRQQERDLLSALLGGQPLRRNDGWFRASVSVLSVKRV